MEGVTEYLTRAGVSQLLCSAEISDDFVKIYDGLGKAAGSWMATPIWTGTLTVRCGRRTRLNARRQSFDGDGGGPRGATAMAASAVADFAPPGGR